MTKKEIAYLTVAVIAIVVTLTIATSPSKTEQSGFEPCVWPNTCEQEVAIIPPCPPGTYCNFQPCVWPNTCNEAKNV